jgi:hypothetical protein
VIPLSHLAGAWESFDKGTTIASRVIMAVIFVGVCFLFERRFQLVPDGRRFGSHIFKYVASKLPYSKATDPRN